MGLSPHVGHLTSLSSWPRSYSSDCLLSCKCMHLAQKSQERECECILEAHWNIIRKSHLASMSHGMGHWVHEKDAHKISIWVRSQTPRGWGQYSEESPGLGGSVEGNELDQVRSMIVSGIQRCSRVIKNKRGRRHSMLNCVWNFLHSIDLIIQIEPLMHFKQTEIYLADFLSMRVSHLLGIALPIWLVNSFWKEHFGW